MNRERSSVDAKGNVQWLLMTSFPLIGKSGTPVGVVCVTRDITQHKQAEIELRRATEAAGSGQLFQEHLPSNDEP